MSNAADYDVAIAGGGLAGLALACLLAERGLAVALVEKGQYPRHRVCGEYVSAEALTLLQHLKLDSKALPRLNRLRITAPNGLELNRPLAQGGIGISRFALDQHLFEQARRRGVTLLTETAVQGYQRQNHHTEIETSQGNLKAHVFVAATGKYSNLDKQLLPEAKRAAAPQANYVGIKYHLQADLPRDVIELHNFPWGYAGISAVEEPGRYCFCYLTTASALQAAGGIKELEEKTLSQNPVLARYLNSYSSLYDKPLAISQITFGPKPLADSQTFVLGDAAGMITPLCGNGMAMALHSAVLAVPHVLDSLRYPHQLKQRVAAYQQTWKRQFSLRLQTGSLIQRLFGHPALTNYFIGGMRRLPALSDSLIGLTHGKPFPLPD